MKICIITLPLKFNYGCLLQAFALNLFLRKNGYSALTANYVNPRIPLTMRLACNPFVRAVRKLFGKKVSVLFRDYRKYNLDCHLRRFVEKNIPRTRLIKTLATWRDFEEYGFDAFVVGSDQVWRDSMSQHLPTAFFDFIPDNSKIKRIAYAASFGVDKFEHGKRPILFYRKLIKKFNAVSVREKDGVRICRDELLANAVHVLDPTMLLSSDDYKKIIDADRDNFRDFGNNYAFRHILNENLSKSREFSDSLKSLFGKVESVVPKGDRNAWKLDFDAAQLRPVSEWLNGIKNAKIVITDSFHCVVFSIIFKTPFVVIGNSHTGLSRIKSILDMFGLSERFAISPSATDIENAAKSPIDWEAVHNILKEKQKESAEFLLSALEK